MDLIKETDLGIENGRCCEEIGLLPDDGEIKYLGGEELNVFCFEINDKLKIWTFCDDSRAKIHQFRNAIKERMIVNYIKE